MMGILLINTYRLAGRCKSLLPNHVAAAFPVAYDSRLGFSFRVLVRVRVRVRVRVGVGVGLGLT